MMPTVSGAGQVDQFSPAGLALGFVAGRTVGGYPSSTQTQAQENVGMGRPANAGPFSATPGPESATQTASTTPTPTNNAGPKMPALAGSQRPSGLGSGIKQSSVPPLLDRLPKQVSLADIKAGSRR